jgi:hypothetical protein
VVVVVLDVPGSLEVDAFRLLKIVDGSAQPFADRPAEKSPPRHTVGISIPAGAMTVAVVVQAAFQGRAVAQGQTTVRRGDSSTVTLSPCVPPRPLGATFELCQSAANPGVPDAADAGAPDAPADASPKRPPAVCIDASNTPDPFTLPVSISDACREYCAAMDAHCRGTFASVDHCLFACATLRWPAKGMPRDDTVECRTNWATFVPITDAEKVEHCRWAAPAFDVQCGELCGVYCRTGAIVCPAEFPPEAECAEECRQARQRLLAYDPPGDLQRHLLCRLERLQEAIFARDRCVQAAPGNACGVCNDPFGGL